MRFLFLCQESAPSTQLPRRNLAEPQRTKMLMSSSLVDVQTCKLELYVSIWPYCNLLWRISMTFSRMFNLKTFNISSLSDTKIIENLKSYLNCFKHSSMQADLYLSSLLENAFQPGLLPGIVHTAERGRRPLQHAEGRSPVPELARQLHNLSTIQHIFTELCLSICSKFNRKSFNSTYFHRIFGSFQVPLTCIS